MFTKEDAQEAADIIRAYWHLMSDETLGNRDGQIGPAFSSELHLLWELAGKLDKLAETIPDPDDWGSIADR